MDSTAREVLCDVCRNESNPSAYLESVGDALVEEALNERQKILSDIEAVGERLNLARRRISAADAPKRDNANANKPSSDPALPWIHSGCELADVKRRLHAAADDEVVLMKLVGDVRQEKARRTEMALDFYAQRTKDLLSRG